MEPLWQACKPRVAATHASWLPWCITLQTSLAVHTVGACRVIRQQKGSSEAKRKAPSSQLDRLSDINPGLASSMSWLKETSGASAVPPWVLQWMAAHSEPATTAVAGLSPAAAAMVAASDAAEVGNTPGTGSTGSTGGSSGGGSSMHLSSSAAGVSQPGTAVHWGFKSFVTKLVPPKSQHQDMRMVVNAVARR